MRNATCVDWTVMKIREWLRTLRPKLDAEPIVQEDVRTREITSPDDILGAAADAQAARLAGQTPTEADRLGE